MFEELWSMSRICDGILSAGCGVADIGYTMIIRRLDPCVYHYASYTIEYKYKIDDVPPAFAFMMLHALIFK